jgi:hypothetical protein
MFQAVFAFGLVVATLFYAVFSLLRFLLPSKKKNTGSCASGSCNCGGSNHQGGHRHRGGHRYKEIRLN